MFDQTFVDGAGKTNRSWTVTLSFALEFLAVGVMILIPLIWTGVLPKASQWSMLTAPAPPPPPAPPSQPVRKSIKTVRRQFIGQTLQAPPVMPDKVAMIVDDAPVSTSGVVTALDAAGMPGAIAAASPSIGPAPPPPILPPPHVNEAPKKIEEPYRQSSRLQAAKCINCPRPAYPPIAKQARIQGAVVLSAVIAKNGTVQMVSVVSSANPLLIQAAMEAVKKWVYVPTILNGEAVEVVTEITVNFALQ